MFPYTHHTPVQNIWFDLSKKEKQRKRVKIYHTWKRIYASWLWSYSKAICYRQIWKHNHLCTDISEKLWIKGKQNLPLFLQVWPWINFLALLSWKPDKVNVISCVIKATFLMVKITQLPGGSYSFGLLWVRWLVRYVPRGILEAMPIKLLQEILAFVMHEASKPGWLPNLPNVDTVSLHLSCD